MVVVMVKIIIMDANIELTILLVLFAIENNLSVPTSMI